MVILRNVHHARKCYLVQIVVLSLSFKQVPMRYSAITCLHPRCCLQFAGQLWSDQQAQIMLLTHENQGTSLHASIQSRSACRTFFQTVNWDLCHCLLGL